MIPGGLWGEVRSYRKGGSRNLKPKKTLPDQDPCHEKNAYARERTIKSAPVGPEKADTDQIRRNRPYPTNEEADQADHNEKRWGEKDTTKTNCPEPILTRLHLKWCRF